MRKPKKQLEFKELQKIWYDKLRKSGFEDIEQDETKLKTWSTELARDRRTVSFRSKELYYYKANHFLHDYEFESNIEKVIWEYHSNNVSFRDISKILNAVSKKQRSRMLIFRVIRRLQEEMKLLYPEIFRIK